MPILKKEIKATWCHDHEVWECYWIDGLGQEVGTVPLKSCHKPVTLEGPWCEEHKPDA